MPILSFIDALAKHDCHVIEKASLLAVPHPDFKEVKGAPKAREWFDVLRRQGATGWAQFSDAKVWIQAGALNEAPQGILLAAELFIAVGESIPDGGESHHLRHDGEKWVATKITRKAEAAGFLETRTLLHSDEKTKLTYQVAWTAQQDGPLRPTAFRLVTLDTRQS